MNRTVRNAEARSVHRLATSGGGTASSPTKDLEGHTQTKVRAFAMHQDTDPALPVQPSQPSGLLPARPNRRRQLAQRLRIITARTRALVWKLVKLSGEEFVKGFANKAGAIAALVLSVVVVSYLLNIDPADAVRRMLGM